MEILSLVIGLIALFVSFIQFGDRKIRTKRNALALLIEFREEWDRARVRNKQFDNEVLYNRGLDALQEYNRPLRRSKVWFNRAASRELNRLGHECHQVMNLMIRNQVTPDQWPKLSGNIGRQLRATMDALD